MQSLVNSKDDSLFHAAFTEGLENNTTRETTNPAAYRASEATSQRRHFLSPQSSNVQESSQRIVEQMMEESRFFLVKGRQHEYRQEEVLSIVERRAPA